MSRRAELDRDILSLLDRDPEWWDRKVVPKLVPDGDCLVWSGFRLPSGYGQVYLPGVFSPRGTPTSGYVHRVAYMQHHGEVITSEVLDHLCRNRACAYVPHLDPVSQRDNLLRGDTLTAAEVKRTVCPKGHPTIGPDALLIPSLLAKGMRACLVCHRERSDFYNAKAKRERQMKKQALR